MPSQWWTYTLSDFLLFSPRTYYRLFELYNADIWPAQIMALLLGFAIAALIGWGGAWRGRVVTAILGLCWIWIAWAFHYERYATINWAATYVALGFAAEGLLLIGLGLAARRAWLPVDDTIHRVGLGIFLFALVVQPVIGPLTGRAWGQVELFGVAPDPTAVATLGALLCTADRAFWWLAAVPLAWCAITGMTLWTMEATDALVTPLAALVVVSTAIWKRSGTRARGGSDGQPADTADQA